MSDEPKKETAPPPITHTVTVDYSMPVEFLASVVADQQVPLENLKTALKKVYEKNWGLIVLYVVISLSGDVGSYFLQGWVSVMLAVFVSIITTVIGFYAIVATIKSVTTP